MIKRQKITWQPYPDYSPCTKDYYLCAIRSVTTDFDNNSYLVLYWNGSYWEDRDRMNPYQNYELYIKDNELEDYTLMHFSLDPLCYNPDVIAFSTIPKFMSKSKI